MGAARAGVGALRREHQLKIDGAELVGCSINLDAEFPPDIEGEKRWDYVLIISEDKQTAIGMEPHPAIPAEVDRMIGKKTWAEQITTSQCPRLNVQAWCWIASGEDVFIFPNSPAARRLADARVHGPFPRLRLKGK